MLGQEYEHEHELLVHVGASRAPRADRVYQSQLKGFLDFQPALLDGQDVLTQKDSQGNRPRVNHQLDAAAQTRPAVSQELPGSDISLPRPRHSTLSRDVGSAHHLAPVQTSPTVQVKRSPAGVQNLDPVPGTPTTHPSPLIPNSAAHDSLLGSNAASVSAILSIVPDTARRASHEPGALRAGGNPSIQKTRLDLQPAKRQKMSGAESESSTEYWVPAPQSPALSDVPTRRGSQSGDQGGTGAADSTQEAYRRAAIDLAAVIDLTSDVTASLHKRPCQMSTAASLARDSALVPPTQEFSPVEQIGDAPKIPRKPAASSFEVDSTAVNARANLVPPTAPAIADNGNLFGTRKAPLAVESIEYADPGDTGLNSVQPTTLRSTTPKDAAASTGEIFAWPVGGNLFVFPDVQPKLGEEFVTHLTPVLTAAPSISAGAGTVIGLYQANIINAEPATHDRGCWVFRIPSVPSKWAWTQAQRDVFWKRMASVVEAGSLGPVSIEQVGAQAMSNQGFGCPPGDDSWPWPATFVNDDWCRVFCWGEVIKEVWCVMYKASDGRILELPGGMRWVAGEHNCKVVVPASVPEAET